MSNLTGRAMGPNADPRARAAVLAALRKIDTTGSMATLTVADIDAEASDAIRRQTAAILEG